MRATNSPTCVLLLVNSMTVFGSANAQEIAMPAATEAPVTVPVATPGAPPGATPTRGALMSQVQAKFGTPAEIHGAVGNPPITRWDYPGFSVFFEHQHVIHAVLK